IAFGKTLEAVCGAMLARRFAGGAGAFEHAADIFRFVFFAALPSTILSATIGVTSLFVFDREHLGNFLHVWFTWWTGDFASDLIIAPLVFTSLGKPTLALASPRIAARN